MIVMKNSKKKVTVGIPVYNEVNVVEKILRSGVG